MKIRSKQVEFLTKIAENNLLNSLPEDMGELGSPLSLDKIDEYVQILFEMKDLTEEVSNTNLTIKIDSKLILDEISEIISNKLDYLVDQGLINSFDDNRSIHSESASTSAQILKRVCNHLRDKLNNLAPIISQLKEECQSCDYFVDFDIISDVLTRVREIENLISGSLSRSIKVKKAGVEIKTAAPTIADVSTMLQTTLRNCNQIIQTINEKYNGPAYNKSSEFQEFLTNIQKLIEIFNQINSSGIYNITAKLNNKIIKLSENFNAREFTKEIDGLLTQSSEIINILTQLYSAKKTPQLKTLTETIKNEIKQTNISIRDSANKVIEKFSTDFGMNSNTLMNTIVEFTTPKLQEIEKQIQSLAKILGQINNQKFKDSFIGKENIATKQYYLNTIQELINKETSIKKLLEALNQSMAAGVSNTASYNSKIIIQSGISDWINGLLGKVTPKNINETINNLTSQITKENNAIFQELNTWYLQGLKTIQPGDPGMQALGNALKTFQNLGFQQGGNQQTQSNQPAQQQQQGGQRAGGPDVIQFLKGLPGTTTVADALKQMGI